MEPRPTLSGVAGVLVKPMTVKISKARDGYGTAT